MTDSRRRTGRKTFRVLRKTALWSALAVSALLLASLWVVPWLGRRGSLNSVIEGIVRSALDVPVSIESVVSEPFSKLTVTRLRSIRAQAEDRLRFEARSISVFYDPIELLQGKIRTVTFETPDLYLDLDAPLAGVARVPQFPPETELPPPESPLLLPFSIDSVVIEEGSLRLRFEGRELLLSRLDVRALNVGKASGQRFTLGVEALGGRVRASGGLSISREEGKPARYVLETIETAIEGIPLAALEAWLSGEAAPRAGEPAPDGGTISLAGSLVGTWPERVDLELEGSARAISARAGGLPAVSGADVVLRVEAAVFGDLERIELRLRTEGRGSVASGSGDGAESASLDIQGEFLRSAAPGGLVELRPSSLVLEGIGLVRFSGSILSPFDPPASRLRISADIPHLRPGEVLARLPRGIVPPGLDALPIGRESRLDIHLEVAGTVGTPRASGSFNLRREPGSEDAGGDAPIAQIEASGWFEDAEADPAAGVLSVSRLAVRSDGIPAPIAARVAGIDARTRGTIDLEVEARDLRWPAGEVEPGASARVAWRDGGIESPAGFLGVSGVDLELACEGRFRPRDGRLDLDASAGIRVGEMLLGTFYAEPRRPFVISASGGLLWNDPGDLAGAEVVHLSGTAPGLGPLRVEGFILDGAAGGLDLDGRIELPSMPLDEAYRMLIREWIGASVPFLAGGELAGRAGVELVVKGPAGVEGAFLPPFSGRLGLGPAEARMPGLNVDRLEVEAPVESGPRPPPLPGGTRDGVLRADRVESGPALAVGMRMPFRFEDGRYQLTSRVRFRALEGSVEIREAAVRPGGDAASIELSLRAKDLALAPLAGSRGLPPIQGRMSFDFDPIVLQKGLGLDARGTLVIEAFGGTFTFEDLRIRNLSEPYSNLRLGRGKIEGLRLADIGRTFDFGILSGVLRGEVRDLSFTGGEVTSFEIDAETVPVEGIPQYVDKRAIASIRRILSGPIGVIEEGLFSRFRFHKFGFWCQLRDGVFRLEGKYRIRGVEYVMYGDWYQFPRIDIVNARPGKPYQWRSILERIRQVSGSTAEE